MSVATNDIPATNPSASLEYCACVGRADALARFEAPGLDPEQSARGVVVGPLTAVAVRVPASMFVGSAAEANLADINWLGPRVEAHERLVQRAAAFGPVLPAQFGAVFSCESRLIEALRGRSEAIEAFLDEAECHEELGIKVFVRQAASGASDPLSANDGAGYLLRRREALRAAERRRIDIDRLVEEAIDRIGACVADAEERRVLEADHGSYSVERSWALWVPREKRGTLAMVIERLNADHASEGIGYRLDGPWPAYSFSPRLVAG
ncbi:MAG: GvpL/GvpF family gas vesicle protein [Phycisphaerales bacterium]